MSEPEAAPKEIDDSLDQRFRRTLLLIALPLLVATLALAFQQYRGQRQEVLEDVAARGAFVAHEFDSVGRETSDHVKQQRAWASDYFAHPVHDQSSLRRYFRPRKFDGILEGYTLDAVPEAERASAGQLLWFGGNFADAQKSERLLDFSFQFFRFITPTFVTTRYFQWSYFFPASRDHAALFPWVPSADLVEKQGHANLAAGIATWFEYEIYRLGTPELNPQRSNYWTAPYRDAFGTGAMISYGAPIYAGDEFMGIVGTDLRLDTLRRVLDRSHPPIGRTWLIDGKHHVLVDSARQITGTQQFDARSGRLPAAFVDFALTGKGLESGDGLTVVAHDMHTVPWRLVQVVHESDIWELLWPRFIPYIAIIVTLKFTVLFAFFVLRRDFIRPALRLVGFLRAGSRDPAAPLPGLPAHWEPWGAVVARTFADNRLANEQLRQSQAQKAAILENVLLGVVTTDANGLIVEFNAAAERMFKCRRVDVLGKPAADLLIDEEFRAFFDASRPARTFMAGLDATGRNMLTMQRADGEQFPVEVAVSVTHSGDQTFRTALIADRTEQKHAQDELARQREKLRQSEKLSAMGALLAGVAHELNNPLSILMGRAVLLESRTTDSAVRGDAGKIRAAAERCGRIVHTFLSMARQRRTERQPSSLNEVVAGAIDLMSYNLRSSGIEVKVDLDPALPVASMDRDQVGQVVLNLLVNAQQALCEKAPPRAVRIESFRRDRRLNVRISDNGPGIPPELRDRIFDPFFTTKTSGAGTGMGLSVSRSIVREHGGDLILEPGTVGASFVIQIPVERPGTVAEPSPGLITGPDRRSGCILVVDDETEVAAVLADILHTVGYKTAICHSGREALATLEHREFDVVLSDIRMPDMDGPSLYRELLSRYPDLARRVIFITGDTLSPGIEPFLRESGRISIEKPVLPQTLLDTLRAVLPD